MKCNKNVFLTLMLFLTILLIKPSIIQAYDSESEYSVKIVNTQKLLIKSNSDPNSKTITTLSKGDLVIEKLKVDEYSIIDYGKEKGYVLTSSLKTPSSETKMINSKNGVNVKGLKSKSSTTKGKLENNAIVEVYESSNGWSLIQSGYLAGYVPSNLLTKTKTSIKYLNNKNGVIVRKKPSYEFSTTVTGNLTYKTKLTIHSTKNGWSYITHGAIKGYVENAMLSSKVPDNNTQQPSGSSSIKGNITWQYNKFIGTKPDVGASVLLFPINNNPVTVNQVIKVENGDIEPSTIGIYYAQVDGYGSYELSNLPAGEYIALYKSSKTFRNISEPMDITYVNTLILLIPDYEEGDFGLKVFNNNMLRVKLKDNEQKIMSKDWGFTYM